MKRLVYSSIHLTLIRALGILFQAGVIFFLANRLPIADVGVFATVYAFLGLLRFLGPLGSDQVVLRRVADEAGGQTSDASNGIFNASLALTFFASGMAALLVPAMLIAGAIDIPMTDWEIAAIGLSIPAFSLMGVFIAHIRASGWNLAAQTPEALGMHVLFALQLGAVVLFGDMTRQSVLLCLCTTSWAIILLYIVLARRYGIANLHMPSLSAIMQMAREGWHVFLALVFTALAVRAPVILTATLEGASAAAVMDIAIRFGTVATLTTGSIGATFSPEFARLSRRGDSAALWRCLRTSGLLAGAPALLWLGMVIFGAPVMVGWLLPITYTDAVAPMTIIAFACAINAGFGLAQILLLMQDKAQIVERFSAAQLAVIIVASLFLMPLFGVTGIAWAMVLAALIRDGGAMGYVAVMRFGKKEKVRC